MFCKATKRKINFMGRDLDKGSSRTPSILNSDEGWGGSPRNLFPTKRACILSSTGRSRCKHSLQYLTYKVLIISVFYSMHRKN